MNKIYKTLLTLFLCFTLALANVTPIMTVIAEEIEKSKYTDVLTDLTSDETFNTGDYPSITDTSNTAYGSISVIQVAESIDDELFIYTYQPSESAVEFTATSISMWDSFNDKGFDENAMKDFHPQVYELELLSKSSVFAKYLVKDYTVSDEGYRYYNIAVIYRPYDENIDEGLQDSDTDEVVDNGATVERAYAVGQQWCMYTFNDVYHCEMVTFETMEIDITYHGYINLYDALTFYGWEYHTIHFLAFNCEEYKIKHIYDADISFSVRSKHVQRYAGEDEVIEYGEWGDLQTVTLFDTDTRTFEGRGFFSSSYTWNRISTGEEFVSSFSGKEFDWSEDAVDEIEKSEWVFAFHETELLYQAHELGGRDRDWYYYETGQTAVLRIHFMDINNKIYNLAVVSDKTNSAQNAAGVGGMDLSFLEDSFQWLILMLGIIAIICIIGFSMPLLTSFGKLLVNVCSAVFDVAISILAVPFELIGNLFGSGGKKKK